MTTITISIQGKHCMGRWKPVWSHCHQDTKVIKCRIAKGAHSMQPWSVMQSGQALNGSLNQVWSHTTQMRFAVALTRMESPVGALAVIDDNNGHAGWSSHQVSLLTLIRACRLPIQTRKVIERPGESLTLYVGIKNIPDSSIRGCNSDGRVLALQVKSPGIDAPQLQIAVSGVVTQMEEC